MLKWLYQRFSKKPYEVSILIPTYDNVEFLEECMSSVINSAKQCCDFEILLGIDNCKKTLEFVSSNKLFKNGNIKIYYFPKNVGPYIVRNSLAAKAKYDNILFFDSDDVMMQETMPTLMSNFKDGKLLKWKFYNFENENSSDLKISPIFAHASFLINKTKFYKMNGFFGWKCGADAEFDERYIANGNKIDYLDKPLHYRRYHGKNITRLPETGLNSKIRNKYSKTILDNRINAKWKNPDKPQVFPSNFVNV